jgi:hypothetical protein
MGFVTGIKNHTLKSTYNSEFVPLFSVVAIMAFIIGDELVFVLCSCCFFSDLKALID